MDVQVDKEHGQVNENIHQAVDKINSLQHQAMKDFISTMSELNLTSLEILNLAKDIAQRLAERRARK